MGCYSRTSVKNLVSWLPTGQNYAMRADSFFWVHLGCQVYGHGKVIFLYMLVDTGLLKEKNKKPNLWVKRGPSKALHLIIHYDDVIMKNITMAHLAAPARHVLSRGLVVLFVRSWFALYPLLLPHCWPWNFQVLETCGLCNKDLGSHCQLLDYPHWVLISVTNRDNVRWIPMLFFPALGEEMCVVSLFIILPIDCV